MKRHFSLRLAAGITLSSGFRLLAGTLAVALSAMAAHADPVDEVTVSSFGSVSGGPVNLRGELIQGKDGAFYGVSQNGGSAGGLGTVFRVTTDGTLTVLHSFGGPDGLDPQRGLAQGANGTLYGTTYGGGSGNCGTVFSLSTSGTFKTLHSFGCDTGGGNIDSNVVIGTDGFLYGTANWGEFDDGEVYRLATNGSQFTIITSFNSQAAGEQVASPGGGLMLGQDGNFYGAALGYKNSAGTQGYGAIYRVTPSGVVTVMVGFTDPSQNPPTQFPPARDAAGNLYFYGGTRNSTMVPLVYRATATGTLSVVQSFSSLSYVCPFGQGRLLLHPDGRLYGVAGCGGTNGEGFSFSLATDGSDLQILHNNINNGIDVVQPDYGFTPDSNGGLWSMSSAGAANGQGGVYRLDAPTVTLKVAPRSVALGKSAQVTWSSTEAAECIASGAWTGKLTPQGSLAVTPGTSGNETFSLTCNGAGSAEASAVLKVKP